MTWTKFWDMHTAGRAKTEYEKIYVEALYDEAVEFFESRFETDPHNVSCRCCGQDFSIDGYDSLQQATAYHRNCKFVEVDGEDGGGHWVEKPKIVGNTVREHIELDEYVEKDDVAVFYADDVSEELS